MKSESPIPERDETKPTSRGEQETSAALSETENRSYFTSYREEQQMTDNRSSCYWEQNTSTESEEKWTTKSK